MVLQKSSMLKKTENSIFILREKFYSDIRLDTEMAKNNQHIRTITFDFQKNLPLPQLPVGDLFYVCQLWVYVFGNTKLWRQCDIRR